MGWDFEAGPACFTPIDNHQWLSLFKLWLDTKKCVALYCSFIRCLWYIGKTTTTCTTETFKLIGHSTRLTYDVKDKTKKNPGNTLCGILHNYFEFQAKLLMRLSCFDLIFCWSCPLLSDTVYYTRGNYNYATFTKEPWYHNINGDNNYNTKKGNVITTDATHNTWSYKLSNLSILFEYDDTCQYKYCGVYRWLDFQEIQISHWTSTIFK